MAAYRRAKRLARIGCNAARKASCCLGGAEVSVMRRSEFGSSATTAK